MRSPRKRVLFLDSLGYESFGSQSQGPPAFRDCEVLLLTGLDLLPRHQPELSRVLATDTSDEATLRESARFLVASAGGRVDRVVAVSERRMILAAELREEFGAPGMGRTQTLLMRDKIRMKEHVELCNVRVPPYSRFSLDAGLRLIADWNRVVVKPRLEAGSVGVHVVSSASELVALVPQIDASELDYEVEAFIDGQLFHVDSLVIGGRVMAATAGRSLSPTDNVTRMLPYKDASVGSGDLLDSLLEFNERVVGAFPEFTGVTHHEMFVDPDGEIFFCEIGGRPGGGGTSAGFKRRTGVDLFDWSMRAQLGSLAPVPSAVDSVLTGYVMIYDDPRKAARACPGASWIVDISHPSTLGRLDRPPRSWSEASTIVTVEGATSEEVEARLDLILAACLDGRRDVEQQ